MGSYNFSDSDTESEGSYSRDDVWGDDSDTSDESNEEQETFYDENPYCLVSRWAMQKIINEKASCKYCNGSLTIIDVITCLSPYAECDNLLARTLIVNRISFQEDIWPPKTTNILKLTGNLY